MRLKSEVKKVKVNDVTYGHAFFYKNRFWIRLNAKGEIVDSVNASKNRTYVANLENGGIVLLPDETLVTLVDAECIFYNEVFADA